MGCLSQEEDPQVAITINTFGWGSLLLKEWIKAVLLRWVQLSHITSVRKKKLIVT